jgi:hypothetical protein
MAKLYVHGHPVTDFIKKYTSLGGGEYRVTIRLMSDGKLLKKVDNGKWKIAHLKPEIMADPNALEGLGYVKTIVARR